MYSIVGVDPGTRTAGVCVLHVDEQGWRSAYAGQLVLPRGDALAIVDYITDIIRDYAKGAVSLYVEDYRHRVGISAEGARVLAVVGVLNDVARQRGWTFGAVSHAEWKSRWTDYVLLRLAAGQPAQPKILDGRGEHAKDAIQIALSFLPRAAARLPRAAARMKEE